jgi:hypothetical protein
MRKPKKRLRQSSVSKRSREDRRRARRERRERRSRQRNSRRPDEGENSGEEEKETHLAGISLTRVVMMKRMRFAVMTRMDHEIRRERLACREEPVNSA